MWVVDLVDSFKKVKGHNTLAILDHVHLNPKIEGDPQEILKQLKETAKLPEYEHVHTLQDIREIAETVEKGDSNQVRKAAAALLLSPLSSNYDRFVSGMLWLARRERALGAKDEAREYLIVCGQKLWELGVEEKLAGTVATALLWDLCRELLECVGRDPQHARLRATLLCWVWVNSHRIGTVEEHVELGKCWRLLMKENEGDTDPDITAMLQRIGSNLSSSQPFLLGGNACDSEG